MINIAYVALLAAIGVSIFLGWRLSFPPRAPELAPWRRRLLFLGLLANAVSFGLFLAVSLGPQIVRHWSPDIYNYRVSLLVTLAAIVLGAFGRRIPRVLVIVNGLVLAFLWFSLAASSR